MRNFFMMPIKTQLPGALFQASEVLDLGNLQLIAVGNTQKTGPLIDDKAGKPDGKGG
jgi:hypothetical protein